MAAVVCLHPEDGGSPHEAQDLTQAFFAHLIEKRVHAGADRNRGRFRTFLLATLKRFLYSEEERSNRLKRGGGKVHLPIDVLQAEQRYTGELVETFSPEEMFDRDWANLMLEEVMGELEDEYRRAGQGDRFDALCANFMMAEDSATYAEIGENLGIGLEAVRTAARQLRARFRTRFLARLAQQVENPADADDEVRHLILSLGGGGNP